MMKAAGNHLKKKVFENYTDKIHSFEGKFKEMGEGDDRVYIHNAVV